MGVLPDYKEYVGLPGVPPPTIGPEPEFLPPEGWEAIWDDPEWEFARRAQLGLNIIDETADELEAGIVDDADTTLDKLGDFLFDTGQSLIDAIPGIPDVDLEGLYQRIQLWIDRRIEELDNQTDLDIRKISGDLQEFVDGFTDDLVSVQAKITANADTIIDSVTSRYDDIAQTIQDNISEYAQNVEDFAQPAISFIQESLPQQITELKDSLAEGISAIPEIPSAIGEALTSGLDTVFENLGVNDLLGLFQMLGKVIGTVSNQLDGFDNLEPIQGSWDVPLSSVDERNISLGTLPFVGPGVAAKQPAEFDRVRYISQAWTRPNPLDFASTLEYIRRFPEEKEQLLVNLHMLWLSDDRVEQLLKIINMPLQPLENIEAYRRGFIDEDSLIVKLRSTGLSDDDINLIRSISFRLPPIQDLILFSVRGVFDIEESRRFGEFEGLPDNYLEAFIEKFGQGGGDFSAQVSEFGKVAEQLGLSQEWVSAYWASHWRLPSIQTAFEMYHRLNPEIVAAESADLRADGFDPDEISFDRESLDRLIRSADYSGYWRPKLSAIAYRPLTRVDVRRMHKLGVLDDEAVRRSYLKIGYSPTDADRMTQFTLAYNREPASKQIDEVRDLTRSQILDFVENALFTESEAVSALVDIGYEQETAAALVDLTLSQQERKLQKEAIRLIEDQVTAGLIDLNMASLELDELEIPAENKALIIRELQIKLAKRSKQPTRAELDRFIKAGIISTEEYRLAMIALGYPSEWVDKFVLLSAMSEDEE